MKVLITGGSGFIGSRLALRCLGRGDSVRIFGQANNSVEEENVHLLKENGADIVLGSVTRKEEVLESLNGIEHVFHLAAAQHEANVPDQRFWDVNVTGTRNMLEASVKCGVKRFIHGSTIGVYGASLDGTIDEHSSLNPQNIYGVTKLEAENLVLKFRENLPVVIIRISETYGPGDRRLLKLFKAIKKKAFFVIGNGNNLHHLIHVDDLIDGLFLATHVDAAIGKVFVLAGKDILTTREMASVIAERFHVVLPKFKVPLFPFLGIAIVLESILRPLGIQPPLHRRRMDFFRKSFMFSSDQSRNVLGFIPKTSFHEGTDETASWYQQMGLL